LTRAANDPSHAELPPPDALARGDFELVVRRLADDLAFGSDASRFVGGGLQYASSRPYQPGDSVRMLDWRLTARTGRAFTKQHEALKRTCVYVVVDTSASMAVSSVALSKHDVAVWTASALGLVALRRLSPVAVIGGGERTTATLPSLLQSDLWRAIEPLRARGVAERTRLAERLGELRGRALRSSVIVVASDLHDPDAVWALRQAAQQHDVVVLHTLDPSETGALRAGFFRGHEAETGRTFLAGPGTRWEGAHRARTELVRCGVDYLALPTDRAFLAPLRRFLASRGHLMRGQR